MNPFARRQYLELAVLAVAILALPTGCTWASDRADCTRDGDCGDEQVCYYDDKCVPRAVAEREGADVGDECVVVGGQEIGCADDEVCRMGWCEPPGGTIECGTGSPGDGVPLFGGASEALADGSDAVIVNWIAAADETLPEAMRYHVYMATSAGQQTFAVPTATVVGQTSARLTGLETGTTYYFVVRAQDEGGQTECNTNERSATPQALGSCIDYDNDVKPILDGSCIACHSGATPPRDLYLDSYAGVLAGGLTGNEVVPCQSSSSLIYLKVASDNPPVGQRMPLGGPYLTGTQTEAIRLWVDGGAPETCPNDPGVCSDDIPPTFGGLTTATLTGPGSAELCWSAGSDDVTASGALVYDIFEATTPGGEVFTNPPRVTTAAGTTCESVDGLTPGQQYCWVVRARDGAGNRDGNTVEHCVTTETASCIDYATVIQPIFNGECIQCHAGATPPRDLHLDSYAGVIAGGLTGNTIMACQSSTSLLYQKISMATPPIGQRMPADGPPYLTTPQIAAIEQWIDEGAGDSCSAQDICSDSTPPTFDGVETATAVDPTRVELCWTAATDDLTPQGAIVYDAYLASSPGGQVLTGLPRQTSAAGVTCMEVDALSPASQQCFVVRARDGAGNRDSNTVERCVTTPSVPPGCVDYDTMIQPLLDHNCTRCHANASPPQWLRLDSYDAVIAGSVRRNEVTACAASSSLLVNKISASPSLGERMPYDGPPYLTNTQIAMVSQWVNNGAQRDCSEVSSCGDNTAPSFPGATSAVPTDATTIRVCWPEATDAVTATESLRYDVFESSSPGNEAFNSPPQESVVGQLCADVRVGPATTMCFVVRARDLAGNRSTNNVEVCATTAASTCAVDYDPLIQPILTARCTHCHKGDDAPRFLDLRTYGGVLAGGSLRDAVDACDWAGSMLNTKTSGTQCGSRMPRDGPPWLAPSERSLLQAWISSGARRDCTEPLACADTTAPTFAGATSATAVDEASVEVCWNPAVDATTGTDAIVYELYDAATMGGQNYNRPAPYAASGGATCLTVPVPTAQQTCFVVRARDLNGNRDTNTVARCATPSGACYGYDAVVQPVFDARCIHCHSGSNAPSGIRWDTYAHTISNGEVDECRADNSKLNEFVEACEMPQDTSSGPCRACLTSTQTRILRQWVDGGAEEDCPWGNCP